MLFAKKGFGAVLPCPQEVGFSRPIKDLRGKLFLREGGLTDGGLARRLLFADNRTGPRVLSRLDLSGGSRICSGTTTLAGVMHSAVDALTCPITPPDGMPLVGFSDELRHALGKMRWKSRRRDCRSRPVFVASCSTRTVSPGGKFGRKPTRSKPCADLNRICVKRGRSPATGLYG